MVSHYPRLEKYPRERLLKFLAGPNPDISKANALADILAHPTSKRLFKNLSELRHDGVPKRPPNIALIFHAVTGELWTGNAKKGKLPSLNKIEREIWIQFSDMMKAEHVRLFPHYKYRPKRRPKPEIGALPQSTAVDFLIGTPLGPVHGSSEASRKKHERPQQHPYKRPKLQGASANLESLDPPSFPVAGKISPVASGSTQPSFPPVAMNPENVSSPPMPPAYPPPMPHAYSPHLSNDAEFDHLPSDAFPLSPTDGLSTRIFPPSSLFDSTFDMRAYPSGAPSNDSYAHPTIPPESFSYPSQPQPTPTIPPGRPTPAYAAWGFPSQESFDDWLRQSVSHYPR